jgi:adenylate cyclase
VTSPQRDLLGDRIDAQVDDVAAEALILGGTITAVLGVVSLVSIALVADDTTREFFLPPIVFAGVGALVGLCARIVGKRRAVATWAGALVVALASMPTAFFVTAELVVPNGAATYITGPFAHLYAFVVVITGFLLRPRATVAAGFIAAAGFLFAWWMSREGLTVAAHEARMLRCGLVQPAIWLFKAMMILGVGCATAGIVVVARRLVTRVLAEERETQAVSRLFGEFVSSDVRDKILRERGHLKSERTKVVVLFSDIRGFTTFSERTDAALVVARLNEYFERMVEAVEREGGVVDKFIGDAIMATFGGVVPLDAPATNALRAARAMRAELAELNARWARDGVGVQFENGIGLHYGEVIQGPLGSTRRREYTVIGDTVNAASRLEGLTKEKGHAIVMSESLRDALAPGEQHELVELGAVHVKGREAPLKIWGAR